MVELGASSPINVLLVEDDAGSRQLVKRALNTPDMVVRYDIAEAADLASATKLLSERDFDNVILDLHLPDSTGLDTLQSIRKTNPEVPVVVLSNISDHETAVNSIRYGADYYLVKGEALREMLGRSICYSIERRRCRQQDPQQDVLQSHVDMLQYQIRDIKDTLCGQPCPENSPDHPARAARDYQTNLLDTLPMMIWHISTDGKILYANSSAAGLAGKSSMDIAGQDYYSLFAGTDKHLRTRHELILRHGSGSLENMESYTLQNGSIEYYLTDTLPYREKSGIIAGLVIIARKQPVKESKSIPASSAVARSLKDRFSPAGVIMSRQTGAVSPEVKERISRKYNGKVLVVDHDSLNRMLISSHFQGSGLQVDIAVGGEEAVEKARSRNYDLVLTALQMPQLDGLDVVDKLDMNDFQGQVVIMTADYSEDTLEKIKQSRCADYIFKPINKKDLYKIVEKHLAVTSDIQ